MKFFEEPVVEVVKFTVEDIVTTSVEVEEEGGLAIQPCIS